MSYSPDDGTSSTRADTPISENMAGSWSLINRRPAKGIEKCDCPPKYKSASCQDPGIGFYRWYKEHYVTSEIIIDLVGDSIVCSCNHRARECHPETGYCLNCKENTAGPRCDICSAGYYGEPMRGKPCRPCKCPSAEKNYAVTCSADPTETQFSCQCMVGYTGPKCDRCDYGYYGMILGVNSQPPLTQLTTGDDTCQSCRCNTYGSLTDQCDQISGQCYCVNGDVSGRDCSECQAPRAILRY